MLPFKNRLPLRTSRHTLEEHAKTFHSSLFTLLIAPNEAGGGVVSRFAIIVSKKISKLAVERNLLRRQTLGAIQELLPQIKSGFDCLLLAKKPLLQTDYLQIKTDLELLFKKAGLV